MAAKLHSRSGYFLASLVAAALGLPACIAAHAQPSIPGPTLLIPAAAGCSGALAANSASNWFATLGQNGMVCVWSASDGHYLARMQEKGVQTIAVLPDSHLAMEGDNGGNLRLVDFDTLALVRSAKLDGPVQWLAATPGGEVFAITFRKLYRVDPSTLTATPLSALDGKFYFGAATVSEDGGMIGVAMHAADNESGQAVVYDSRDGKVLFEKQLPRITSLALTRGRLAIGSRNSDNIGDTSGHILVVRIANKAVEFDAGVDRIPWSLLLNSGRNDSADLLAGFSGGIGRIDLGSGKTMQTGGPNAVVQQLALSGRSLLAGTPGAPDVCDAETLRCTVPPVVQGIGVKQAKVLPDGSLLLMDAKGNALRIGEDIETSKVLLAAPMTLLPKFKGTTGVFATDGSWVNNALTPVTPSDFIPMANAVPIAVSADGQYLAARATVSPGKQVTVHLYDLSKMGAGALSSPPLIADWTLTTEEPNTFDASAEFQFGFTPDARLLVAVDSVTGSIHRFNIGSGRELLPALNPPGPQDKYVLGDDFVSAWGVAADSHQMARAQFHSVRSIPVDGSAAPDLQRVSSNVKSIVSGRDGSWFLALEDGSILRWDGRNTPAPLATLPYPATSLLYLSERNWLIANSEDGSIAFLDAASGRTEMSLLVLENGRDWLVWTPGGLFDASDNGWQAMAWKFAPGTFSASEPVGDFRDDFYSPGLAASVLAGHAPPPPVLRAKERRTPDVRVAASPPSPAGKVTLDIDVAAPNGVEIRDLHLARNGVLLKTWTGAQRSGTRLAFTADVVAGQNRFTAYAFNQDSVKSVDGEADVAGPASLKRAGDLYVVAIGIDAYRNPAFRLHFARHDAELAAFALAEQRRDIQTFGRQFQAQQADSGKTGDVMVPMLNGPPTDLLPSMGDAHVTTLVDADATRERILKTIAEVAHQARPQDTLIVFYAGHGVALGDHYYLLPQDFSFNGAPSDLLKTGRGTLQSAISDRDLQAALAGEQAAVSALILDSCQSGELVGDKLTQRRGPMDSRGLAQMAYDKGMFILAASLSTQSAAEQAALGDGVLTYALMREGLIEDMASPENVPLLNGSSHGPASLAEWLRWSANRVMQTAADTGHPRGFVLDEKKVNAAWLPVQHPRLFAPPGSGGDTIVALRPINFDPQTMTAAGFMQPAPADTRSAPALPPKKATADLLFRASTLGPLLAGPISADGHQMLGAVGNRILAVDIDHGAVLWRQPAGGEVIGFSEARSGEIAALDQTGNVSIVNRSAMPAVKIVVQGYGFNMSGLVRWIDHDQQLLVVTGNAVAVYNRDGTKVRSVALQGFGVYSPLLTAAGDWLYIGDSSGKVLSYKVPSLIAGPIFASTSQSPLPAPGGQFKFIKSLAADAAGRRLIRIMSDGSVTEAELPSLVASGRPLIRSERIRAAAFSADGASLFVADLQGAVETIRTADGAVVHSWPGALPAVDTLATDPRDTVLVATGNGGMAAWDLESGKLNSLVPGGPCLTVAAFTSSGSIDLMLAGSSQIHAIQLPAQGSTITVSFPSGVFISHNRIIGKTAAGLELWDRADVRKSVQLPLPGDGQLDLTPDGRSFAWIPAQSSSPTLNVVETSSGRTVKAIRLPALANAFALSSDGRLLIYLAGEQLHVIPLDGGAERSMAVAQAPCCFATISPANDRLLLASQMTGRTMLYDLAQRSVVRSLETGYEISTAAFVGKTNEIVLAARDGSVLLWDAASAEAPHILGSVKGMPLGIDVNAAGSMAVVSTNMGDVGWFSLAGAGGQLATTSWIASTQSWLTLSADGEFQIVGDAATPLGRVQADQEKWMPAAHQPGTAPELLKELLTK